MDSARRVWLAGATGLVGRSMTEQLLREPGLEELVALVRRPLDRTDPKLRAVTVDFGAPRVEGRCDVAFCALGTTIRTAGSQARFREVDHDYVVAFGRAARDAGCRHLLVVSAMGASARSLTFYNRVKGEAEDSLRALRLPALTILQPSLLLGDRAELRLGERLAAPFTRLLPAGLLGIEAHDVAAAAVVLARRPATGDRTVSSREMVQLAREV